MLAKVIVANEFEANGNGAKAHHDEVTLNVML
jgi:hypothetical protein